MTYRGTKGWNERAASVLERSDAAGLRAIRVAAENETQFGEFLAASRTPIIELNSSYGVTALRDQVSVTGSGTVAGSGGEILLRTGSATGASSAALQSAELGRYIPGYGAQLGIGVRIPAPPVGNEFHQWGGVGNNDNNGVYFGYDSGGVYVAVEKNGALELKLYQDDWNLDKLKGEGASGYTLDPAAGVIYQIEFTWYGYGQILFGIVGIIDKDDYKQQHFIPCHSYRMSGDVSLETPNLRVFARSNNGGDGTDLSAYVGGRQYSIVGAYVPKFRFTGDFRGSVSTSTTVVPLISFRRKTGFGDRSIKIQGYDAIPASQPTIMQIRIGASLTGASWVTPNDYTAAETALEVDKSATAVTGGELVWQQIIAAGQNLSLAFSTGAELDFDIPDGSSVTLCARTLSGNGSILSGLRMTEEW